MTRAALSLAVLVTACASRAPAAPVAPARWPAVEDAATAADAPAADAPPADAPAALTGVTRIAIRPEARCAIRGDGAAWCWFGGSQLSAPAGPLSPPEPEPEGARPVPGFRDVDALCLGVEATCARRRDGAVLCRTIRTDDGDAAQEYREVVMEAVVPGEPAERLALMSDVCVITRRDGAREQVIPPHNVREGWSRTPFTALPADCALRDGAPRCVGSNHDGLLANHEATAFTPDAPSTLFGLRALREVRLSTQHACAVTLDGDVLCWGRNHDGQLGTGDARSRALPTRVAGLDRVRAVRLGPRFTCALREGGEVWCWGSAPYQLLGRADPSPRPVRLEGGAGFASLEATESALCGARDDGTAWCWYGSNSARAGAPHRIDLAR